MSGLVPGSPSLITSTHLAWSSRAGECTTASTDIAGASVDDWEGVAAEAYRAKRGKIVQQLDDSSEKLQNGAAVLEDYAYALSALEARASGARAEKQKLWEKFWTSGALLDPEKRGAALQEIGAVAQEEQQVQGEAQAAAYDAAVKLLSVLNEQADLGLYFVFPSLEGSLDRTVDKNVLENATWDPAEVKQGQVGDCYLMASLMAMMRTKNGQDTLKRNVRWDDAAQGYWVTLYVDGEPKEYFVDKVYGKGATEGGEVGVVSLYEAAYDKAYGFRDLNDGGFPERALEAVTGQSFHSTLVAQAPAGSQQNPNGPLLDSMRESLASGNPVVAGTWNGDNHSFDGVTVEERDGTVAETSVTIVASHDYEVERVDPDGSVWIRNPHGPGNPTDGGCLVKISPEVFSQTFCVVATEDS